MSIADQVRSLEIDAASTDRLRKEAASLRSSLDAWRRWALDALRMPFEKDETSRAQLDSQLEWARRGELTARAQLGAWRAWAASQQLGIDGPDAEQRGRLAARLVRTPAPVVEAEPPAPEVTVVCDRRDWLVGITPPGTFMLMRGKDEAERAAYWLRSVFAQVWPRGTLANAERHIERLVKHLGDSNDEVAELRVLCGAVMAAGLAECERLRREVALLSSKLAAAPDEVRALERDAAAWEERRACAAACARERDEWSLENIAEGALAASNCERAILARSDPAGRDAGRASWVKVVDGVPHGTMRLPYERGVSDGALEARWKDVVRRIALADTRFIHDLSDARVVRGVLEFVRSERRAVWSAAIEACDRIARTWQAQGGPAWSSVIALRDLAAKEGA